MRAPLVIAALALTATTAYARIGDTIKQVEARYGKPQHVYFQRRDAQELGYRFRGFGIIVHFSNGKSRWESFSRWPQAGALPRMSRESANEILALSAPPSARWQSIPRTRKGEYWVSGDKKMLAFFATEGNVLLVQDPNFNAKN